MQRSRPSSSPAPAGLSSRAPTSPNSASRCSSRSLRDLIVTLETIAKPTVAAIHGTALGGGLELALGCHFRVADAGARLGLPEVKLGMLPGGGGTVRLPRLVGAEKALRMIVSGTPIGAAEAQADGLVDAVFEGDLSRMPSNFARKWPRPAAAAGARSRRGLMTDLAGIRCRGRRRSPKSARAWKRRSPVRKRCATPITLPFDEALAAERGCS